MSCGPEFSRRLRDLPWPTLTSLYPLFAQAGRGVFYNNQSPPPHDPHGKRLNTTIYTTFIFYSVAEFLIFITSWLELNYIN